MTLTLDRIPKLDLADDRVRTRIECAVVDLLVENTESSAPEKEPERRAAA